MTGIIMGLAGVFGAVALVVFAVWMLVPRSCDDHRFSYVSSACNVAPAATQPVSGSNEVTTGAQDDLAETLFRGGLECVSSPNGYFVRLWFQDLESAQLCHRQLSAIRESRKSSMWL